MSLKSIKVKLKTNPNIDLSLRRISGAYRKAYNVCMDAQEFRVEYTSPKNHFLSGSDLLKVLKVKDFSFLKDIDKGVLSAASNTASLAFRLKFKYTVKSIPYLSRKKSNMKFRTNGNIRVHEDHIELPKVGKIYLTEKNRIPLNTPSSKIHFTHDGINWYIVADIEQTISREHLSDTKVSLDFNSKGNIIFNGDLLENVVNSTKYKRLENKLKKIKKKIRRQNKANKVTKFGIDIPVTTKNSKKTKQALDKTKIKLYNIRKESFNSLINEVAITKPKELHIMDNSLVKQTRHGYLTRLHKRAGAAQLLNMLKKKLSLLGTEVIRHSSLESFGKALGCRA